MLYIGLDDTDNLESGGTGYLARQIAATLAVDLPLLSVTIHQLLVDPRVPCTKYSSCSAIALDLDSDVVLEALLERVRELMVADFQPGSDPGLCMARAVPAAIAEFGRRVQRELVRQDEARSLAAAHGTPLLGVGGGEDGIIGAWAPKEGWRQLMERVRDMVALAVPTIVLTTKRAWAMTEAAYARGFDSPCRRPYHRLAQGRLDWALLAGTAAVATALLLWR
jgi:tRNA(Ile2) C34 agmatinyltransferase TiaS